MTHQEFAAILVAFIIGLLLIGALFVLWGGHDKRLDDHDGKFAVLEDALNLGGQPLAVVDPPKKPVSVDTEPQPRVDLAGGARKPVPYKRPKPRHAA